jgi:hypothetical protein
MKAHYLSIVKIIREQLPEVKWMDRYYGQDIDPSDEDGIKYPAIFLEFQEINWQDLGSGVQEGPDSIISFHVCSQSIEASVQGTTTLKFPEPTMKHLQLVDKVNKVFQGTHLAAIVDGKECVFATDMQRGPQTQTSRRNALMVDVIGYKTDLFDYSSSQWSDVIEQTLEAELEMEITQAEPED